MKTWFKKIKWHLGDVLIVTTFFGHDGDSLTIWKNISGYSSFARYAIEYRHLDRPDIYIRGAGDTLKEAFKSYKNSLTAHNNVV